MQDQGVARASSARRGLEEDSLPDQVLDVARGRALGALGEWRDREGKSPGRPKNSARSASVDAKLDKARRAVAQPQQTQRVRAGRKPRGARREQADAVGVFEADAPERHPSTATPTLPERRRSAQPQQGIRIAEPECPRRKRAEVELVPFVLEVARRDDREARDRLLEAVQAPIEGLRRGLDLPLERRQFKPPS